MLTFRRMDELETAFINSYVHRGRRFCKDKQRFSHFVWNFYNPDDRIDLKDLEFVIHHKDGNRLNDSIANLEKITRGKHTVLHKEGKPSGAKGCRWNHSRLSRRKISRAKKGMKFTEEHKRNISKNHHDCS